MSKACTLLCLTFAVAISAIQMSLIPAGQNATALSTLSQISESLDFGAGGDNIQNIIDEFNRMIDGIKKEKNHEETIGLGQCADVDGTVTLHPSDGAVSGCGPSSTCQTDTNGYKKALADANTKIEGLNADIALLTSSIAKQEQAITAAGDAIDAAKVAQDKKVKDDATTAAARNSRIAILIKIQKALHEDGTISMPESLLSLDEKKIIGNSRVTRPILLLVQALQTANPEKVDAIKKLLTQIIERLEQHVKDMATQTDNENQQYATKSAAALKALETQKQVKNTEIQKKAGKEADLAAPTQAKAAEEANIKKAGLACLKSFKAFKNLMSGYDDELAAIEKIIEMLEGLSFTGDTKKKIDSIATCLDKNGGCAEICTMVGDAVKCSCHNDRIGISTVDPSKRTCTPKVCAHLYQHKNQNTGEAGWDHPVAQGDLSQVPHDDHASSVRVSPNCDITLFQSAGFGGANITCSGANSPCQLWDKQLRIFPKGTTTWNDVVSALKCKCNMP